ncbi:MAG TPA: CD225/dispanin family protein [Terriglobia bacterium]|nr:CD225/dispanin family protein [Terriglobia bacterium]HEV3510296.1 CD225/dispanin family protein [Candidatus Sulfotelmatobacter sp.]
MFCPQCGASNADNAAVCAQCGRALQAGGTPLPVTGVVIPPGTTVENYLVFAILTTVLCCLPAGIPAIVYAAQVNGKLQQGDLAGAQAASNNAKMWCWISFGLGLGWIVVVIVLMMVGVLSSIHH